MIDQFWTFLLTITALTLFPGVDSLLIVRNATRGGWRDGVATSTGICCGLFLHALISALGISALVLQSAAAFGALKMLGGGYLIWLGAGSLWRTMGTTREGSAAQYHAVRSVFHFSRSWREGLVCNVFNPKTLLFYMAFLPQFINPAGSPLLQGLFMAAVHFVIAMVYQSLLALLVGRVQNCFRNSLPRRFAQGLLGGLLIFFGLRFVLARRF